MQLQIAIKCSRGELCPRREGLRGHEALGTLCGTLYTSTIIPNPFRYTSSSARPSLTTPTGTSPLVLLLALSCPRADPSSKSPNRSGLQVLPGDELLGLLKCLHDGVSWAERIAISLALYVTLRGYAMLPPTRVWRRTGSGQVRRPETVQQLLVQRASRHPNQTAALVRG